jgi:hypothetical protein
MRFSENFEFAGNYDLNRSVAQQDALQGFVSSRTGKTAVHKRRVTEAAKLYRDALVGAIEPEFVAQAMRPTKPYMVQELMRLYPGLYLEASGKVMGLRETMSVSDYQALFVDVLDRMYYGFYNAYPIVNKVLVKDHTLNDFRPVSRFMLDGMVTPMTAVDAAGMAAQRAKTGPVPQDGATAATATTAPVQYTPALYQAKGAINWRAFVNDDLGIFRDIARLLTIAGNRCISKAITSLFFSTAGLNANLFSSGYGNIINLANGAASNNPPFSAQGLQDAWKVLAGMKDSGGDPILTTGTPYLVYGPSLKAAVENVLSATKVMVSVEGGTSNLEGFPSQFVEAANWAAQNVVPILDPYMPIVMTGAAGNISSTAWAIVMDPKAQARPAVEFGMLRGFDTPQIFQKVPNTMRIGGGLESMMGDWDSMDTELKCVTVFGGAVMDGRSVVGSTGAGA